MPDMKPKIWLIILLTLIAGFYSIWKANQFLEIDDCLDHGGRWNYESAYCDSAEEFALQFINSYVAFCNDRSQTTTMMEWLSTRTDVTQEFKNDLRKLVDEAEKMTPEHGLGFDPIFNAQDYPDEGFKLDRTNTSEGHITVSGKNWDSYKLLIKVVAPENKWLIDGVGHVRIPEQKRSAKEN